MKILFLMITYPDIKENSSMYTDLTQEFVYRGHEIYVAVANGPDKTLLNKEGSVNVLRVRTLELYDTSIIKKGFANILLPYQISNAIFKRLKGARFDAVIVPTPPITYLSTVKKLKKRFNPSVYLILRDIFPQNAKDLGIIKNSLLFNYFRRKEKKLYEISDFIGCMSLGNVKYIVQHNPEVNRNKLHLLPNWKNVVEYSQPDLTLKKKFGLENKFIALYGGNLGKPQQIEVILDLAKEVSHIGDVVFLIIGQGSEKRRIHDSIVKKGLINVILRDQLPRGQYQELVKVSNIGIVTLSDKFRIPNIPSRTLSYWEAKIPILAAIDENTDFNSILEESGSGLWSITGNVETLRINFERLYNNKELRMSMGEKGFQYLKKNCTTSNAYSIINGKINS
jgi:glycosyltransferase involved in cell wall biosynthesis